MYNEELNETSIFLRDHYKDLSGFDDELPAEVELDEQEFAKLRMGHEPRATVSI